MNVDTQKNSSNNSESTINIDPAAEQASATLVNDEVLEEVEVLDDRIRVLEEELQDSKDRFLRNLAEMDNMRRRHERERQDLLKYASEKLLQDLLPVLDSFEKAAAAPGSAADHGLVEGVRMVQKQFQTVLENHGVKLVDAAGKPFDPNVHQAIQRIEDEAVDEEIVKDEFQRGYTLNGRLVRPSMVSVRVPRSGSAETP